jgi:hypothetical protein
VTQPIEISGRSADFGFDSDSIEVIVEARDLDTDERESRSFRIGLPSTSEAERSELERLVAGAYPDAVPRSFANGAATFLSRRQLVVAHFVREQISASRTATEPTRSSQSAHREDEDAQEPLFVA